MQAILFEDISYVALSLILKSNFEDVKTRSFQYTYSSQFLKSLQINIEDYWLKKYVG